MKCYQIDFADGHRDVVDANTEEEACLFAVKQARARTGFVPASIDIKSVKVLDD